MLNFELEEVFSSPFETEIFKKSQKIIVISESDMIKISFPSHSISWFGISESVFQISSSLLVALS